MSGAAFRQWRQVGPLGGRGVPGDGLSVDEMELVELRAEGHDGVVGLLRAIARGTRQGEEGGRDDGGDLDPRFAQGPKDVEEATAHGAAAAGAALAAVVPGRRLQVDPQRAATKSETCGGCGLCPSLCPYKAITFSQETKTAEVNDLLCHGCGVCVAACPSTAIDARHFTDSQILAEVDAFVS